MTEWNKITELLSGFYFMYIIRHYIGNIT